MWWGYSPALDLRHEWERCKHKDPDNRKELNVLLIGTADGRHILKTLAQTCRHEDKQWVNFYVYEASLDVIARQVMLLTIALEPAEELGLQEKTRLFLELYGNSLVHSKTADFIARKSAQFVHMVTDLDFQVQFFIIIVISCFTYFIL
jgi:dynein assembly factor 3